MNTRLRALLLSLIALLGMTGIIASSALHFMASPTVVSQSAPLASTTPNQVFGDFIEDSDGVDATDEAAVDESVAEPLAAVRLDKVAIYKQCANAVVTPAVDGKVKATTGPCAWYAAALLKEYGYYKAALPRAKSVTTGFSLGNAILRYQQANTGIGMTGTVNSPAMWAKLTGPQAPRPTGLPSDCRSSSITICVSLAQQVMYVKYQGKLYQTPVTTAGWSSLSSSQETTPHLWVTPADDYIVKQKLDNPYSTRWVSSMPHSLVLTSAVYIHEYSHVGWLYGSHGCVRVPKDFQSWLYGITPRYAKVKISSSRT